MSDIGGIYSLRLVIADFYMEKPVFGLDPGYSELRGKEIKRVPIVRIFGANSEGQKTCMHVHGVFPYFYIPYDKRDFETLERGILQIAMHLDKAINISLGQGSANAQHVFKIQLVKGIPFYGYHRGEHQFLKIFMFNPRFVRRAANLLQSGAILSKNFNPHESHVPYILQFMIDYNLYGMSYLHVPLEVAKFRRSNSEELVPYANIKPQQLLDPSSVKKMACSELELDISSNFILNRFQLVSKSQTTQTNPGIEAIWHDERVRRQKLAQSFEQDVEKLNALPVLALPATDERLGIEIAESDIFYRTALQSKLLTMDQTSSDQTLDSTLAHSVAANATLQTSLPSAKEQRRTFNLQKLLANAVYPEECSQPEERHLVNASFIQNHLSSSGSYHSAKEQEEDERAYMDDTLVDEQLVLSLTQPTTAGVPHDAAFTDEDLQLLEALQQLEEQNGNASHIDLDSSLAPMELTPELLDKETAAAAAQQPLSEDEAADSEADTSTDNLHDFSTALDDIDELLLKLTQSQPSQQPEKLEKVPQIDGADDLLPRTPKKRIKAQQITTPVTPPCGHAPSQPRTPKSSAAKKYAPLPLIFGNKSAQKQPEESGEARRAVSTRLSLQLEPQGKSPAVTANSAISLRKKLAITELRRKSISGATPEDASEVSAKTPLRRSRRSRDLDKTHITCALSPRDRNPRFSDVFLEVAEAVTEAEIAVQKQPRKPRRSARNKVIESVPEAELPAEEKAEQSPAIEAVANLVETPIRTEESPAGSSVPASDEDEAIVSDTESDISVIKLRKTPNLKRLRRSFRESLLARRQSQRETTIPKKTAMPRKILTEILTPLETATISIAVESSLTAPESEPTSISSIAATASKDLKAYIVESEPRTPTAASPSLSGDPEEPASISPIPDIASSSNMPSPCSRNQELEPALADSEPRTPKAATPSLSSDEETTPSLMRSFYDLSLIINSPSVFSDDLGSPLQVLASPSVESSGSFALAKSSSGTSNSGAPGSLIIAPLELPPDYEEVLRGCRKLDIQEHQWQEPYYSNPADITKMKEVGFLVLQIPGNKLNDCEGFQSVLGDKGLRAWRRQQLIKIGGPAMLQRYKTEQQIREYFSSGQRVAIEPAQQAPSKQEARLWLKARQLLSSRGKEELERAELDSPIKVKRQKITMMLNAGEGEGEAASGDEELDCSGLTLTPGTPQLRSQRKEAKQSQTPASSQARQRRSKRGTKLSFKEAKESNSQSQSQSQASSQSQSQSEQSVASSVALAELERSSFVRQLEGEGGNSAPGSDLSFGLTNATLNNTFGFKVNLENLQQAKADIECHYLTTITLELFVPSREDLLPDPLHDEIRCLFYAIEHSMPSSTSPAALPTSACGYIIVNDAQDLVQEGRIHGIDADIEVQVVQTEAEALEALVALCTRWDADIYAGYEIEMGSWGYVIERAKYLCFNIAPLLSRVPSQKMRDFVDEDREQFTDLDVEMKICGRILLDVWRLMRSEIALTSYTFENVMYHILHKRCPWHSPRSLTSWFASPCTRWIAIEYYLERVRGTLALLDQLDLIGRTSEMAKLIGIQFYEVLSRGSQFRVESMMLRIAKPKNLVPLSPSVQQRAHMRAPEYLALIMEPQSRFYADPLIVLDFQSLYPSMIIAYNYCFSTCLGRVEHLGQGSTPFEFAASQLRVSPKMLEKLLERDLITVSPAGVVFVKSQVREGILPRMLSEILDTRQMVKQSMKLHKQNGALQRVLHSRQLGLKLVANTTYGYTAANFSGRMPAVEVGDSVVAKGRETLERAIKLVEANDKWNVRIVYGDTDSMFVLVPGRNRAQAFKIGEEIAEAVTKMSPQPVKLKLEKVYQPCLLQTKKRYVGYMYETADQAQPVYEAKGIETVRRDGCPAVAKMLEKVLRILFETADVSQVKQYVCRQFTKLLSGRANLQDLIFAKEFRGLNGYKPTACVPALELTRRWLQSDPRHVPRRGERVPYIIINGPPGMQLIRLVRSPQELLQNEGYKINAIYYITKAIIPPLNRCLLLIGADVNEWFANLPRKLLLTPALSTASELVGGNDGQRGSKKAKSSKSTISQYFSTTSCIIDCGRQTKSGICLECASDARKSVTTLHAKMAKLERGYQLTQQICQSCCGRIGDLNCGSLDCPVLYVLEVKRRELQQLPHIQKLIEERF